MNSSVVTITIVALLVSTSAPSVDANLKHTKQRAKQDINMCKKIDAAQALKRHSWAKSEPCTGKLISNHNPKRIPQVVSEIVCPTDADDRCIQMILPMGVGIFGENGDLREKTIYVPSGCIDSHQLKSTKGHNKSHKSGKPPKNKKHRSRRYLLPE